MKILEWKNLKHLAYETFRLKIPYQIDSTLIQSGQGYYDTHTEALIIEVPILIGSTEEERNEAIRKGYDRGMQQPRRQREAKRLRTLRKDDKQAAIAYRKSMPQYAF